MSTDHTLARVFADLETDVPDAEVELAALGARIARRPRRRAYAVAATGVVTACVVALTLTLGVSRTPPTPAPDPPVAARSGSSVPVPVPQPALHQVAYAKRISTTTGKDGITRPELTMDAGWLPEGASVEAAGRYGDGSENLAWDVRYKSGDDYTYRVDIGQWPEDHLPQHWMGDEHGDDITVAGRPARIFAAYVNYQIFIDRGNGMIASVAVWYDPPFLKAAKAKQAALRVANSLRFGLRKTLPVKAVLTRAPAEAKIVSVDAGALEGQSTDYVLNDADKGAEIEIDADLMGNELKPHPGVSERQPGVVINPGKWPKFVKGKPGRKVQGKDTVVWSEHGRTVLFVKGLGGPRTKLTAGAGAETLAELYLIADGIRVDR